MTSPDDKQPVAAPSGVSSAPANEGNRTRSIATRLTDAEFAEIESAAVSAGKKVAEWLREAALTHARTTGKEKTDKVVALRRLRYNGWRIARELHTSRANVSRILRRHGMNRLRSLEPPPPVLRYEHKRPGDLIHFDIKRLARIVKPGHRIHGDRTRQTRGAGYEYLHIAIDDHSRISFAAILPDQKHTSAIRFFHMAPAHYSRFGFGVKRILTDNGSCYRHWIFQKTLREQNLKHRFTRAYRPQTNGKAERFIQTALRQWAYARSYLNSTEREIQLDSWLHDYNFLRPHASLNLNPPVSRSGLSRNNLLSLHS